YIIRRLRNSLWGTVDGQYIQNKGGLPPHEVSQLAAFKILFLPFADVSISYTILQRKSQSSICLR
ncbi:MAG: hypothetical protein K2O34_12800, partial [Acetatifactor sp.]|nr:hypothetical protein [Acetatifactor sp.]